MAKLIYQHPTDNVAGQATSLTPSTEDATYPKTNLYDQNPARPFKFTTTNGNLVWDFTSPIEIDLLALIHHNIDAGLEVRFQGNATDVWTSPTIDEVLTVLPYDLDGFSKNVFLDLTTIPVRTFRYWRLVVVGTNSETVAIGEAWLSANKRSLDADIFYPATDAIFRPNIEHVTDFGISTIYDYGVKTKSFEATCQVLTPTALNTIRDWWDATKGRVLPFILVVDAEAADEYGVYMARWASVDRPDKHVFPNITEVDLAFTEVARGLPL